MFRKDQQLAISDNTLAQLQEFLHKPKFYEDQHLIYPGAPTEEIRLKAESLLNEVTEKLIANIKRKPKKSYVLNSFRQLLPNYENFDSEECDRICSYLEEIMSILGIESSDGILNKWRYGFPL